MSTLTNEIDARPSDAIALAVRAQSPIFVAESVMDAAAFIPSEETDKVTKRTSENEPLPNTKEAKIAALQTKLREAIESEEYERAAKLRDDIQKLANNN